MQGCDPVRDFAAAVHRGMGAVIEPIPDGNLHRFDDPNGKPRNGAGWYVLHVDGIPAGAYGSWISGATLYWRGGSADLTPSERVKMDEQVRRAKLDREHDRQAAQVDAARRAAELWEAAKPASAHHPYLRAKRVSAAGLRQAGDTLLVPLRNIEGDLVNLQRIAPDGCKWFLRGGRVTGSFYLVGPGMPNTGELYIAEGASTAKTVAASLNLPVAAAMNAGNLLPVAKALRSKLPRLALVVAADNDWKTPGNPGLKKAREAAKAVGGAVNLAPVCMAPECHCTDFNDLANCGRVVH